MDLKDFLNTSYTAYHAVENIRAVLDDEGFSQVNFDSEYLPDSGYITRNGSSIVAFRLGGNKVFNIAVSHTDTPSFKIKGNALIENDGLKRLDVEKYGGGLLYSYFDRPMKIAGRLLLDDEGGITQLVTESDYNVVIPSLAIHLNRESNEKPFLNVQKDLLPLYSQDGKGPYDFSDGRDATQTLYESLASDRVLDADLYVVPVTEAFNAGVNGEFLCSPRIDNLTSVYSSVYGLIASSPVNIDIVACLDNEEIGSGTRQGAPSFLQQVIDFISDRLCMTADEKRLAAEYGFCLSADNGHAAHPAHPEKHDPVYHCRLNGGIVIKHHVNYATDGLTSAIFKQMLESADLPYQDLYNNSELSGGTTLGLSTARQLGIRVCDIGLAQLAMHSACETVGSYDAETMMKALTYFFSTSVGEVNELH